jgi:hypothetical protein
MALNFPNSPINNEIFTDGNRTWRWDESALAWISVSSTAIPVGETAGSSSLGYIQYSGLTSVIGQLNGGTTDPSANNRLNYNGNFHATKLFSNGNEVIAFSSYELGDIIYASSQTTLSKLSIVEDGFLLTSVNGIPAWVDPSDILSSTGIPVVDGIWDLNYSEDFGIDVSPYSALTADNTWVNDNTNAGKFYIGSENPIKNTRLNYNGDMYATRIYNAVYNDLAEFMLVAPDQNLIPGDVVSSTAKGLVRSQKGDRNVIGVYSDTYGYALGADNQEKKIPVGISGRVLVKVIGGQPYPGDLLVAGLDGYAEVNNEPKIGTVIGKIFDGIQHPNGRYWMLIMNS